MSTAYSQYIPQNERPVITGLIQALLDNGYTLTDTFNNEVIATHTEEGPEQ